MSNELIEIKINENQEPIVSGRMLHEFLEIGTEYAKWFSRMVEYGFSENQDYLEVFVKNDENSKGGRPAIDHAIKLDMAKEIAMIQRSEKGKQARQYFIKVEKEWNSPEKIMARALKIANDTIASLNIENKQQQQQISQLTVDNTIMQPKAEYFDELVDRNLLTNFRETAKQLEVKEKVFINFLIEKKYIYRDKKGKLLPYADKNKGLFEVKECFNEKTNWSGTQTLITPKGRETFRLLMI